jgi:hypothetical protein
MQTFAEFIKENYEITEEEFEKLETYKKRNIDREYDCYIDTIIK